VQVVDLAVVAGSNLRELLVDSHPFAMPVLSLWVLRLSRWQAALDCRQWHRHFDQQRLYLCSPRSAFPQQCAAIGSAMQ
jgi:hypothetical protein